MHWLGWRHHLREALVAVNVVAGIFMAVGFVFFVPTSICSRVKQDDARSDIQNIGHALELYRRNSGHYPSTTEGLQALVSHQALERLPIDPWGTAYHYALGRGVPRVWTDGADGLPGGEGDDADVFNRSLLPRWLIESDGPPLISVPPPY